MSKSRQTLAREDRARMERLFEEVQVRLQEMALIGVRCMSANHPEFARAAKEHPGIVQFARPRHGPASMQADFHGTEIICYGSGENMCLCYDYDAGVCELC